MEKAKLIGIQRLSYVSQRSGENVQGYSLFLEQPLTAPQSEGSRVDRYFVSDQVYETFPLPLVVGSDYLISFNRYGRLSTMDLISGK